MTNTLIYGALAFSLCAYMTNLSADDRRGWRTNNFLLLVIGLLIYVCLEVTWG